MKAKHIALRDEVITRESQISEADWVRYDRAVELELIRSVQAVCEAFEDKFQSRHTALVGNDKTNSNVLVTLRMVHGLSHALDDFDGGIAELKARRRVLDQLFGKPSKPVKQKAKRARPRKPRLLRPEEIRTKATEILELEIADEREIYLGERNAAIAKMKSSSGQEKSDALDRLNGIEAAYARLFSEQQNGKRLHALIREVRNADEALRPPAPERSSKKPLPQKAPQKNTLPAGFTEVRGGGLEAVAYAMGQLYRETRQSNKRERNFESLHRDVTRHPFKTNDTKDDRQYQTHGVRNPRAKKDI